jgi:hypothetical protein
MKHISKSHLAVGFFLVALAVGFWVKSRGSLEGFMQKNIGMPLDGPAMGPYDTSNTGWSATETNHMPVGGLPQNSFQDTNKLMHLTENKTSPDCCPSTFSTDSGCLCLSQSDKDLMASRGGNK